MKAVLALSLLLASTSAHASFLCSSKEVREDGKALYGMSVDESLTSDTGIVISVWTTGHANEAVSFDCTRTTMSYGDGRTSQYTCANSGETSLQVFAQENRYKFTATMEMASPASVVRLANMYCKQM